MNDEYATITIKLKKNDKLKFDAVIDEINRNFMLELNKNKFSKICIAYFLEKIANEEGFADKMFNLKKIDRKQLLSRFSQQFQ